MGKIILNGIEYSGGAVDSGGGGGGGASGQTITQADYNVLTADERNNGTIYFVTDSNPPAIYYMSVKYIGAVWG